MLLITRKNVAENIGWNRGWQREQTVHGAYHSLFNDLLSTDSITFKNFMRMDFPAFEDLLSRAEAQTRHRVEKMYLC